MLNLFLIFLKIGVVSFGGGYAMIPLIREEVLANGWMIEEEFLNFIAIAESTPGPIAINMATFIGFGQYGFLGALLATLGVVLPSFIIILFIAALMRGIMKFAGVGAVLKGVRPVIAGLIFATGISLFVNILIGISKIGDPFVFDWRALVVFSIVATISIVFKKIKKKPISAIVLILISAVLGILLYGVLG